MGKGGALASPARMLTRMISRNAAANRSQNPALGYARFSGTLETRPPTGMETFGGAKLLAAPDGACSPAGGTGLEPGAKAGPPAVLPSPAPLPGPGTKGAGW